MKAAVSPPLAQLGRYELLTQLAEGGMARVFLAISRGPVGFNKLMVVKQIRPELAADEEFLGMFSDEARLALALHHPNIVETYEIFEEDGRHLMAMEYLDGQTLADLLARLGRDRMPLEEHVWILTQVLAALHHAHELSGADGLPMEVVHRDVSPSNVFLTYDGRVKLLDFGIAKAAGAISTTARGTVKAKIGYGAPEQFLSQKTDRRADIFSVGVMLWEALAGCRRKIGETRNAMIEARIAGLEPSIRAIRPQVPPGLAAICDRATAVRPESRQVSADELSFELEQWLATRPRPVGAAEIGALVCRFFSAERQARRRAIETQLGGSDSDITRTVPPGSSISDPEMAVPTLAPVVLEATERPTVVDLPPTASRRDAAPRPTGNAATWQTPTPGRKTPSQPRAVAPAPVVMADVAAVRRTPPGRAVLAATPTPASVRGPTPTPVPARTPSQALNDSIPPLETWEMEPPPRPSRRRWLVVGAALSAIAGATVAVVAIGGESGSSAQRSATAGAPAVVDVARVPTTAPPAPATPLPSGGSPGENSAGAEAGAALLDGPLPPSSSSAATTLGGSDGNAGGKPGVSSTSRGSRGGRSGARSRSADGSSAGSAASSSSSSPTRRLASGSGGSVDVGRTVERPSRSVQPGEELSRPSRSRRPRRSLDEEDPYK